jgi:hypothetical protein
MLDINNIGYGGAYLNTKLPNILAELQGLTISGPLAGAAANTPIAVLDGGGIEPQDTILKVLMFTAGVPSDITLDTTIVNPAAVGTITLLAGLTTGDMVSVNGKTYSFLAIQLTPSTNMAPYTVPLDLTVGPTYLADAANSLAEAIMSGDSSLTCIAVGAVVTINSRTAGVLGNTIPLSVAASNAHATASGVTLAGGTATNAISISVNTAGNTVVVFWYNQAPPGYVAM